MTQIMEIFVSALVGELVSRSMSSIISKCSNPPPPPPPVRSMEADLERVLLRGQVIVDEAARRHITNQAMLRQLAELRDAVYRGYHVLDTFRCRRRHRRRREDEEEVLCLSSSKTSQDLEEVFHGLRAMIQDDAGEMAMFLSTYPPCMYRQPYSMHLLLDKCMFGRQMEMQQVINFLLCSSSSTSSPDDHCRFDVLPIVGPARAGKSTLVAHVCGDERVRDHFSQILFFSHGSFRGEEDVVATLRDRCSARHEKKNNVRLLVVVDIVGEIDDHLYESLSSLCQQSTTSVRSGSKIIVTGQSDKIRKLGTTAHALTLKNLSHEAYWYFFKVITFGSTDPDTHPRLVRLAMAIARTLNGNLVGANIMACLLRDNFSVEFWRNILAFRRRYVRNHLSEFGEHPYELIKENRPTYIQPMGKTTTTAQDVFVLDQHHTCSSEEEVPKMKFQDVVCGSVMPQQGPFKVLKWKSRIPPYYCYICTCEIQELQTRAAKKRKRARSPLNRVN